MTKPELIVTRKWPASVEARLTELFDVELNKTDTPFDADRFVSAFQNFDAVLPTVSDSIPAAAYTADGLRTKLLANFGVGYNHIDVAAAHEVGITITNTPGVLTD